jgi:hypothetical protein
MEPVRVYAGLESGQTVSDRVDLAVDDLKRAGGFDRKALIVVTTTGTGWVNAASVEAAEYITGGDVATVGMQYSYLPSWISFLADRSKAQEAGVALFEGVYQAWSQLPPNHRPKLYIFGESLGSFGGQDAFTSLDDMRSKVSGAVLTGTQNFTTLWKSLEDNRDPGSPEILPVYQQGHGATTERETGKSNVYFLPLGNTDMLPRNDLGTLPPMPSRKRLSTAEAAEVVGLSERRIRQLAEFLHAERDPFGKLHFDPAIVDAFAIERQAVRRTVTNSDRIVQLEQRVADLERAVKRLSKK